MARSWRVRIEDDVVLLEESEILDIAEKLLTDEELARLEEVLRAHVIG